jgi:hypothetical protein
LAAFALWVFVVLAYRGQPGDDPYITYHYASNLASGNGFVFNVGERVQSTTAPLFTLVLALFGFLSADIPTLGYFLSTLCLLAFALFCVRLTALARPPMMWLGLGTAALTFICPVTTFGLGTEMPLLVALSWGCWLAAARERWHVAAVLAALAAITRGDGVLVGVALALVYVWNNRRVAPRRWPWSAALLYVAVVAPWYIFAWIYFGSPLPATLGVKLAQGSAPGTVHFFEGLGVFWARSFGNLAVLWVPALLLGLVGYVVMFRRGAALALPAVWAALYMIGFSLLQVPRYPWYYAPLAPVAMLALLLGGQTVLAFAIALASRFVQVRQAGLITTLGTVALCLLLGGLFLAQAIQAPRPQPTARSQLYLTVGDWLRANTPAQASVGAEEVGLLGYGSQRRIVDFVGLIQPEVAVHHARGEALWAAQRYQPDYIVALPTWLATAGTDPWVQSHYQVLRTFETPAGEHATLLEVKDKVQGTSSK